MFLTNNRCRSFESDLILLPMILELMWRAEVAFYFFVNAALPRRRRTSCGRCGTKRGIKGTTGTVRRSP